MCASRLASTSMSTVSVASSLNMSEGAWGAPRPAALSSAAAAAAAAASSASLAAFSRWCLIAICSTAHSRRLFRRSLHEAEGASSGFHICTLSNDAVPAPPRPPPACLYAAASSGAGIFSSSEGRKSMTRMVTSSAKPLALIASCCMRLTAAPAFSLRTLAMTVLACTASHSPSLAMMRRAPAAGMVSCLISGSPMTVRPASWSPRLRVMARPPGHTRSGPATTPSTSLRAISPPAALTRACSSGLFSTRWLPLIWMISVPVSTNARESPTLATTSSHPTTMASVAVVPLVLKRRMHSESASTNPACSARGRRSIMASCTPHTRASSCVTPLMVGSSGTSPRTRSR
mmetsp:Transcript_23275/g.59484  ORF Transcript_23275/g.59484 Transcript_23275/m.59484 type:complete len:346 (-) Transcript_23275:1413-2450(-)